MAPAFGGVCRQERLPSSMKKEGTASGVKGAQVCPFKYPHGKSEGLPFPYLGPDTDTRDC